MNRAERLRLEGRWDDALAALPDGNDLDTALERVRILADRNTVAGGVGEELERAVDALAAAAPDDRRIQAFVLSRRGLALHSAFLRDRSLGEPPDELPLFEEALAIRREAGDEPGIAESLFHVGLVHQVVRGDSATALPFFEEAYARAKAGGDGLLMSYAVRHVAFAHMEAGVLDRAEQEFRESLALRQAAGWVAGIAAAEIALAQFLQEQGRAGEAEGLARSGRETLVALGATQILAILEEDEPDRD